ncbi:MAG: Ig-like domain-containing protein [Bacteroidales bacterium]|nr:Ig-like domain-containing protein [Bacteroidales bacterium]
MKKKLLLTLACLCGIVMGAKADGYGLKIADIDVVDENKGDLITVINAIDGVTATGSMSYNNETQTLTLKDVNIDFGSKQFVSHETTIFNEDTYCAILVEKALTIEVTGTNSIKYSGDIINVYANLTISGNGSLSLDVASSGRKPMFIINESTIVIDKTTVICLGEDYDGITGRNVGKIVINQSTMKSLGGFYELREITVTNARISEPEGAFVAPYMIADASGNVAKNVVIVPDTRKEAGLSWSETNVRCDYGNAFDAPTLTNESGVAVTFESDHPEFATIDATGKVTIVKPSIVDYSTITCDEYGNNIEIVHIKAIFAGNTEYKPQIAGYSMIILKGWPNLSVSGPTTIFLGETFENPVVIAKNNMGETLDLTLTFSSENESVATVDATTGAITPVGIGQAHIIAVSSENEYYYARGDGYYLTVKQRGETTLSFAKDSYTAIIGQDFTAPVLTNSDNVAITYSSSDETVAQVDATSGSVTVVGIGETVITATFEGNDDYKATSASYTLTVKKITPAVAFAKSEYAVAMGDAFESPVAVTTPEGLAVTYRSSEETVATVNTVTGELTILAAGETIITASFEGDDHHEAAQGSYKLTVSPVSGIGTLSNGMIKATVYDLLGRRVKNVTKGGIYVVGGHKVMK